MLSAISRNSGSVRSEVVKQPRCDVAGSGVLLPVVFQHLIARRRNPGTILLKAGQNREITLIYDRAAEAMNIARAGFLLVRCATLLGDGPGGNRQRQQDKYQERFMHRIPSF
jgi:hypothetical protein